MREMTMDDYEQVHDLWMRTENLGVNPDDDSFERIEKYLDRNPHLSFVEEREGKIVGVILSGHDGRRGSLHHLAVDKNYRRQGIGKALCEEAIKALKKENIIRVALFVYKDNDAGTDFWKTLDFNPREDLTYMDRNLLEIITVN